MKYINPIICADYSDPDVIKYKDSYYLTASSFNHTPGLPILKSKNLVNWKIVNYVYDRLPQKEYDKVVLGGGSWAPSIRYHKGVFYALIPFPDEGIYVSTTTNIEGSWSKPKLVIKGKGLEDPCPIWDNGKCYVAVGFAKSRAGFNSCIGLYEVNENITEVVSESYTIIYDGHNDNPTIEGPKFYKRNGYFYIMAPAGSVKSGWQTCLRSNNIYGPYESKVVLYQSDTNINGPHQGALVDTGNDTWAFIHFRDVDAYGRITYLEPVVWYNDWPICGEANDLLLAGKPVYTHDYIVDKKSNYKIDTKDSFKGNKLSLIWQLPCNKVNDFYNVNNGLTLKSFKDNKPLNLYENVVVTKPYYFNFKVSTLFNINNMQNGDEAGLLFNGLTYHSIYIIKRDNKYYLEIKKGSNTDKEEILYSQEYNDNNIIFNIKATNKNIYDLEYKFGINNKYFKNVFYGYKGRWIGSTLGLYIRNCNDESNGNVLVSYFNQVKVGE